MSFSSTPGFCASSSVVFFWIVVSSSVVLLPSFGSSRLDGFPCGAWSGHDVRSLGLKITKGELLFVASSS